jgi:hypothetical protein
VFSPQARSFAGEPGASPGEAGVEKLDSRECPLRGSGRGQVRHEQPNRCGATTTELPMLAEPTNDQRLAFELIGALIPLTLK